MAQDQSIEAARARIQRLVDEIAALSKKELRSEEYFQQFLTRAVQATDGRGGAVWLVSQRASDGKSEFQLAAQVEFESSLFHTDEVQHGVLLRGMSETVQTKKPVVLSPEPVAEPGSLQAQLAQMQGQQAPALPTGANRTPYPFFHVPLLLKDQVLGVLQIWLQPYVKPPTYAEFITFLSSLVTHVEQHMQSRRLGNLVAENQRLQHVLRFVSDIAGSLDPIEVARLAANYGRDLVGCERCSVLTLQGDRWKVLAISGQEVVEPKSSMVKAMSAFVGAHARLESFVRQDTDPRTGTATTRHELLTLNKKELLARAEAASAPDSNGNGNGNGSNPLAADVRRTDEIDLAYFEHSHVVSAAIAPMFDGNQQLVGAYFAESTGEGFFESAAGSRDPSGSQRLTEWLAIHTGKALQAATDYRSLPLLPVSKKLRDTRRALTGKHRHRVLTRWGMALASLSIAAFYPKQGQVEGNCVVTPAHRTVVVPEVPGRVEKVLVREGDHVTKGQAIAQLDVSRLQTELESAQQERLRSQAEADRYRALGDEAAARVQTIQAGVAEKNVEKIQTDIAAATLRSPLEGVVLTKDLELHSGEFIQAGSQFAEIATLDDWELQVEISEKHIGWVEKALVEQSPREVNYILYSQSAHKLHTELKSHQQISAMAYPREKDQVFVVTFPKIEVPDDVQRAMRPGLTGRARIALGHKPRIWWMFRRLSDWVQLKLIG